MASGSRDSSPPSDGGRLLASSTMATSCNAACSSSATSAVNAPASRDTRYTHPTTRRPTTSGMASLLRYPLSTSTRSSRNTRASARSASMRKTWDSHTIAAHDPSRRRRDPRKLLLSPATPVLYDTNPSCPSARSREPRWYGCRSRTRSRMRAAISNPSTGPPRRGHHLVGSQQAPLLFQDLLEALAGVLGAAHGSSQGLQHGHHAAVHGARLTMEEQQPAHHLVIPQGRHHDDGAEPPGAPQTPGGPPRPP